jgi:hypothetical protein
MTITKTMVTLGAASLLAISGCVGKVQNFKAVSSCDHTEPKQFTVKISVGKDASQPPKVQPELIVACFADEIVFKAEDSKVDFRVKFNKVSPFKGEIYSSKGVVTAKINVQPRADTEGYKYAVVVPGYPPRDPWIRIVTR